MFSSTTIRLAFDLAGGRCEKCHRKLLFGSRGAETKYGWEAHHRNSRGPDSVSNCEILCQKCHKNTQSYGG